MVAVVRAHPNPPQAAQAPRETDAAVRNLASVAGVIVLALPESSVRHGHEELGVSITASRMVAAWAAKVQSMGVTINRCTGRSVSTTECVSSRPRTMRRPPVCCWQRTCSATSAHRRCARSTPPRWRKFWLRFPNPQTSELILHFELSMICCAFLIADSSGALSFLRMSIAFCAEAVASCLLPSFA